ncbi:MAG: hypothetical protein HKP59_00825, partial [Lutibacter sp.]|uniref:hypothetical protein n=1 Tax=Lutibacter sp. TaxID=1925666 RepID=UPI0017A214FB
FGGYGFWSARNFIIFFDENLKEWEVINPENTSLIPEESFSGMHIIIGDEFYIFNSNYNNPINRFENIFNTKLWKYNFTKKTWSLIGETDFVEQTMFQPEIKINNKLLINLSSKIVIIDILNNNISEFEKGPHSHQIYRDFTSIFNNERFYYFTSDNKQNLYIVTATESEMIGKKISSKSFYSNNQKLKTLGISVFVLILIIGFFRLYKKYQKRKNRIQLLENGLLFKKRFVQLDKESNKILRILIKNEFVNSSEILKIIEKEQFSRAHNERLKFQKIEELNFQIKMLLSKDEDLIISRKSSFDRRIREYILINRESFVN